MNVDSNSKEQMNFWLCSPAWEAFGGSSMTELEQEDRAFSVLPLKVTLPALPNQGPPKEVKR